MPKEPAMIEIEKGSANVYEDLGLPDAAEMQVKAILGIPQPKLSGMLRGQFRGISEVKMLECMNRLGRDVEIVVRKPSRSRTTGQTRVVFA
jgi:predicted XRE-type DNA-binding protein